MEGASCLVLFFRMTFSMARFITYVLLYNILVIETSARKISKIAIILTITVGLLLAAITAGMLTANLNIPSSGTITSVNVDVYSDITCTEPLTSLSWGTIAPGDSVNQSIYIKNTGNTQITLSMSTANWDPAGAEGFITITWDKSGASLDAEQIIEATLTLSVDASMSGIEDFSVEIVIVGTTT